MIQAIATCVALVVLYVCLYHLTLWSWNYVHYQITTQRNRRIHAQWKQHSTRVEKGENDNT